MTDLQKWEEFLSSFGIGYERETHNDSDITLKMEAYNEKVEGYLGFYIIVLFNMDGMFISVGAYE